MFILAHRSYYGQLCRVVKIGQLYRVVGAHYYLPNHFVCIVRTEAGFVYYDDMGGGTVSTHACLPQVQQPPSHTLSQIRRVTKHLVKALHKHAKTVWYARIAPTTVPMQPRFEPMELA